jgi:hypothetical protein
LNSGRLDTLHDAEEKYFLSLEEMVPIAGQDVSEDLHVERRRAEAKESHVKGVGLDTPTFPQQAADALEDSVHLQRGGPVTQTQDRVEPELVA